MKPEKVLGILMTIVGIAWSAKVYAGTAISSEIILPALVAIIGVLLLVDTSKKLSYVKRYL